MFLDWYKAATQPIIPAEGVGFRFALAHVAAEFVVSQYLKQIDLKVGFSYAKKHSNGQVLTPLHL